MTLPIDLRRSVERAAISSFRSAKGVPDILRFAVTKSRIDRGLEIAQDEVGFRWNFGTHKGKKVYL